MVDFPVTPGSFQNPPKQFTYAIAAGESVLLQYAMNFMRILSLDVPADCRIKFGQIALETDVVGAGIGYEFPEVIKNIEIINVGSGTINITVACAVGRIFDDRLNVSGSIFVVNAPGTCLEIKNCEDEPVLMVEDEQLSTTNELLEAIESAVDGLEALLTTPTAASTGQTSVDTSADQIVASNAARKTIMVTNQGSVDCFIGISNAVTTSTGILLAAGSTKSFDYSGDLYAITASSSTTVGYFSVGV